MRLLSFLLLFLAVPAVYASEFPPHGVVLMYHRFGEHHYPTTNIRLAQFESQLNYLKREGYTIWPLRRLLDAIFNGGNVPDKTIALTVDDAYRSVYQYAYPLIRERGLPLTVFVSTDAIDHRLDGYMSWAQMREMKQHGVDFANHSAAHGHLQEQKRGEAESVWKERVMKDILKAQQRIDKELGDQGMRLFAYPFGEFSCPLGKMLREMGYVAFGQHSGAIGPLSRREALPRFPINEHFGELEDFSKKVASLPYPIIRQSPLDPLIGKENPPDLTLELAPGYEQLAQHTHCYLGTGIRLKKVSLSSGSITVRAFSALRAGRSRYNCTAPANDGRNYWLSQPWQNGPDAADPGR